MFKALENLKQPTNDKIKDKDFINVIEKLQKTIVDDVEASLEFSKLEESYNIIKEEVKEKTKELNAVRFLQMRADADVSYLAEALRLAREEFESKKRKVDKEERNFASEIASKKKDNSINNEYKEIDNKGLCIVVGQYLEGVKNKRIVDKKVLAAKTVIRKVIEDGEHIYKGFSDKHIEAASRKKEFFSVINMLRKLERRNEIYSILGRNRELKDRDIDWMAKFVSKNYH